jgi:hypothetical protein
MMNLRKNDEATMGKMRKRLLLRHDLCHFNQQQNLKKLKKFHKRTMKARAPRPRTPKRKTMTMQRQKEPSENIWKRWRELNAKKPRELLLRMLPGKGKWKNKDKRRKWKLVQANPHQWTPWSKLVLERPKLRLNQIKLLLRNRKHQMNKQMLKASKRTRKWASWKRCSSQRKRSRLKSKTRVSKMLRAARRCKRLALVVRSVFLLKEKKTSKSLRTIPEPKPSPYLT